MSNPEHLQVLKTGSDAWNAWRAENPRIRPDLSGADFRKRSLRNYNLSKAKLSGADLRDVSFRRANLTDADLSGARLHRAFFSLTRLQGANFAGCLLYETVFANVNLGVAKNVAELVHRGPSVVDHRTLTKSQNLPLQFLQGCGLPDSLIAHATRKNALAERYWSCFISYSSEDEAFVQQLHGALQQHGVRCWFAPKDLRIGAKIRDSIDDAIREMGKLLLVLSESATTSAWVEKEFETAFDEERRREALVVFPIRIDDAALESDRAWARDIRRTRNIGDFSGWRSPEGFQASLARLLRDLLRHDQSDAEPLARADPLRQAV